MGIEALHRKAILLMNAGRLQEAAEVLDRICNDTMSDSLLFRTLFLQATACYGLHNYQRADAAIEKAKSQIQDTALIAHIYFISSLINIQLDKWEQATADVEAMKSRTGDTTSVSWFFRDKPALKSKRKSRMLSYLIPGAGQAYAGRSGSGLVSLAGTTGSATFLVLNAIGGMYVTSATAGLWLFTRFYFGGAENAVRLTELENSDRLYGYKNQVIERLKCIYLD
jgi:tetratricopeptide (TPR) repeat protein